MKKLIINIGQEAVVGATYEVNGKDKIINRVFEFPCLSYYNNVGAFEFPRMIATIKRVMPKDVRGLDIDLILPTYVTDVEYVDAVDSQEDSSKGSKKDRYAIKKTIYIGENQTKKINQNISFNGKMIDGIVTAFHKEKLNVVRALSNVSCYHNFMSVFNQGDIFSGAEHKTHICVVWGSSKIYYVIMIGNLPVEIRISDLKFTDMHRDIASMGGDLPLYQILNVMDSFTLDPRPEVGLLLELKNGQTFDNGADGIMNRFYDGEKTIMLSEAAVDLIKERFVSFIADMIREIRTMYDYVGNKYNSGNVCVCTNSKMIDECICKTLSDQFPIEYLISDGHITVYDHVFTIRGISEFVDKYNPILGCVIETIKKGGDFYDA